MKRVPVFVVPLLLAVCPWASAKSDTLRVLAIGNSFSQDAVEQNLHEIAAEHGDVYIIGNMYIGGCTLERHWRNSTSASTEYEYRKTGADGVRVNHKSVSLDAALEDEAWDAVSFQQASGRSGLASSYEPYLRELVSFVRARVRAETRLYWHQTWAYDPHALHGDFPNYTCSCTRMYEDIVSASRSACERHGLAVIPSGTAVQNLRGCEHNMTRDGFHLNYGVGRYVAALTWYETLSGNDVTGTSYRPDGVSAERAANACEAAHNAVQTPFACRPVGYSDRCTYDEAEVSSRFSAGDLPDALTMSDGRKVRSVKQWQNERRPELLELFTTQEYGRAPGKPEGLSFELIESGDAFGGLAVRKQVRVRYGQRTNEYLSLLLYVPKDAGKPVPVFLGINFAGNTAVTDDPSVLMPDPRKLSSYGVYAFSERGAQKGRWCIERLMNAGYAVATFDRADVDPDFDDHFTNGVHGMYLNGAAPADDGWGTIAAWAWGLSRALDYLETEPLVDASKVAVIGHSRLGKTALWAGAVDTRFAMAISNDSGCGGAAISRRAFGETVAVINHSFPHWFCENFNKYNNNENALPFDQHELVALMAPRPVYVASASEDSWADPVGEGLAASEAAKVYSLWGRKAVQKIGRHIRPGKHDICLYDWEKYIEFADKWLK